MKNNYENGKEEKKKIKPKEEKYNKKKRCKEEIKKGR